MAIRRFVRRWRGGARPPEVSSRRVSPWGVFSAIPSPPDERWFGRVGRSATGAPVRTPAFGAARPFRWRAQTESPRANSRTRAATLTFLGSCPSQPEPLNSVRIRLNPGRIRTLRPQLACRMNCWRTHRWRRARSSRGTHPGVRGTDPPFPCPFSYRRVRGSRASRSPWPHEDEGRVVTSSGMSGNSIIPGVAVAPGFTTLQRPPMQVARVRVLFHGCSVLVDRAPPAWKPTPGKGGM
jgi:hypothetical protein